MRISDFLLPEAIADDLKASNKPGVLMELIRLLIGVQPLDPNELADTLRTREKIQSTGIGDGVAIPHGKSAAVDQIIACFGRSRAGVDFQSLDGLPSHLFFAQILPESKPQLHLKALARISRLFREPEVRQELIEAPDAVSLYQLLLRFDERL